MLIGRVPDGEFFFLPSCQVKFLKFYTYIIVIRVKNENCESLQNFCTDFLVAL